VSNSVGFGNQALFISLCEKHHPHLRTSGYWKPRSFLTRLCKSPGVTLLGLISDLGPFGLLTFYVLLLTRASRCDFRNLALPLICSLSLFYSRDLTFTTVSFTLAVSPSLLQFIFGLRSLLAEAMAEECSPLLDVVGDMPEVTRPDATRLELSVSSSSSEDSSWGGSSEDAKAEIEKVVVVDPVSLREAMISGSRPSLWAVSSNWKR
jgi:hypothetical protein